MSPIDPPSALDERAAHWAVRVDADTLTATERAQFDAWIAADVRHAGAFARAMAANAYFDRAAALRLQDVDVSDTARDAVAPISPAPRTWTRRSWIGGGLGAIAAGCVAAIGLSRWRSGERIAAPMGSVRRAALADGSAVTLNTNAEIAVTLEQAARHVRLIAGEVNFDIAKDHARPFLVDAGPVRIRVVGTSFLVRRTGADDVAVTVREGIVEVRRGTEAPARLVAGDRLVFNATTPARREALSPAQVDRMGLWQRGEVDLTGMTLGDAAREYARYSDRRIIIADPQVASLKVAGIFSTSDPAGFAQAAAVAQDLTFRATPEGLILSR